MYAFLPELIIAVPFMRGFGEVQALQQALAVVLDWPRTLAVGWLRLDLAGVTRANVIIRSY